MDILLSNVEHITDPNDLEVGKLYFLECKNNVDRPKLSTYFADRDKTLNNQWCYFENRIWTFEGNNQGMDRWNIYGPIKNYQRRSETDDFDLSTLPKL